MAKQTKSSNNDVKTPHLKKLLNHFYKQAKENLHKDGHVAPAIFLFSGSPQSPEMLHILFRFSNQEEKDKLVKRIRAQAKQINAWGYVFLGESWFVRVDNVSQAKPISLNIQPSKHPNREECVFVALVTKNWQSSKAAIFKSQGNKKIIAEELSLPPNMQMGGRLMDILQ